MADKCKCPPEGSPEWMTTYGDMMTLLLCFFVLIVSMSEIKKPEEYDAVMTQIKESFGMYGGGGKIPIDDDPTMSLIKRLEATRLRQAKIPNKANTKTPAQKGQEPKVTKVREGLVIGAGGKINFEPASAVLRDDVKALIAGLVESAKIRGSENILELRGHASAMELAADRPDSGFETGYGDVWELTHARSKAVYDYLTEPPPVGLGLSRDRFRITANGAREPLQNRAYTTAEEAVNRRVEILVSETLVSEMAEPEKI